MIVVSLYASVNLCWFGLERCFLLLVYVVLRSGIRMGDLFCWCIAFRWHVFLLFIYVRKVKFLAFGSLFSFICGKIVLDRDRGYANRNMIFRLSFCWQAYTSKWYLCCYMYCWIIYDPIYVVSNYLLFLSYVFIFWGKTFQCCTSGLNCE